MALHKILNRKPKVDPHARRFGVEIECGLPDGEEQAYELFPIFDYDSDEEFDPEKHWTAGQDGSGVEVRTPILQGPEGFETLRWAMSVIKGADGYVSRADGLHVHHDAPEFVANPELCLKIVDSWRNNETKIHEMVAPHRRGGYGACPTWRTGYYNQLKAWVGEPAGPLYVGRNDLNLSSLRGHGSIEIRLHEGTLDADVAIAWIQFGQRFIHQVVESVDPLASVEQDLLVNIQLSDEARAILAEKAALGHITPGTQFRDRHDGDW